MVSENKKAKKQMVKMEILYEVSAKEGESPVHNYLSIL